VVGEATLNIVRFLLGIAEAGFFPGVIFFLTLWFPSAYRARIIGWFPVSAAISFVIGSPISGLILEMEGIGGLHGWQWMFLIEALPALLMTFAVLYYLTDRPLLATWLEPDELKWRVT
jgi:MFS transporter, ACS family, tartrate transporter